MPTLLLLAIGETTLGRLEVGGIEVIDRSTFQLGQLAQLGQFTVLRFMVKLRMTGGRRYLPSSRLSWAVLGVLAAGSGASAYFGAGRSISLKARSMDSGSGNGSIRFRRAIRSRLRTA